MIQPQTLRFLSALKKNNNKPWFDRNKATYTAIKTEMEELAADLIAAISKFDPSIGHPDPRSCLFRINRDVRFSKDKSPYKTALGIAISRAGKNFPGAGYYIHIQPGQCFLGGGCWMPMPDQLARIRQEIDYNYREFKKIVESPSFRKTFGGLNMEEKLSRPPKGYLPGNPAIEYLKLKSFTCGHSVKDTEVLSTNFIKSAASVFKQMHPFMNFLNASLG